MASREQGAAPVRRLRGYVGGMTAPPMPRPLEDRWEYLNEESGVWQTPSEIAREKEAESNG